MLSHSQISPGGLVFFDVYLARVGQKGKWEVSFLSILSDGVANDSYNGQNARNHTKNTVKVLTYSYLGTSILAFDKGKQLQNLLHRLCSAKTSIAHSEVYSDD